MRTLMVIETLNIRLNYAITSCINHIRSSEMNSQYATVFTNDEATACKFVAQKDKLFEDNFLQYFISNKYESVNPSPEIKIGYSLRVVFMRNIINKLIENSDGNLRILNLGCGYDTLYWNLRVSSRIQKYEFFDLDLDLVVNSKIRAISKNAILRDYLVNLKIDKNDLHSNNYHLMTCNLEDIESIKSCLSLTKFDKNEKVFTIIIAECVLIYLHPTKLNILMSFLGDFFDDCFFLNYEPMPSEDKFSRIMVDNVTQRGCSFLSKDLCNSIENNKLRFINNCWQSAFSQTMLFLKNSTQTGKLITDKCFIDERILLDELLEHYAITIAYKSTFNIQKLIDTDIELFF